jgi:hypothetical protein
MVKPKKVSGIDVNEDMDFQRREWLVQRVAWLIMAFLLLAAALGLFGRGPLSRATAGQEGGPLWVTYERLDRYQAPTELEIIAGPNTAQGEELRLTLNQEFLDRIEIDGIEPEPDSVEAAGKEQVYVFKVADPSLPTVVHISYQFTRPGSALIELGLEEGSLLNFNQFVFP